MSGSAYEQAGVNIDAGHQATEMMKAAVRATHGPEVLAGIGAFGGLFDGAAMKGMTHPVLVASTDGVGTKTKVASRLGRWDTIGHDIVNHCVNDILVQGARPLFFLDYVAAARLDPVQFATVVNGVAAACAENGCALLGGESAEMPGVYHDGALDLVGTVVGVVDRASIIDGARIEIGDQLIGLPSSGPHTNGYTLLRSVLGELDWQSTRLSDGVSVADAILAPHRSYLRAVMALLDAGVDVRGLAHITGGGLIDNIPRILPAGVDAVIRTDSWQPLPIFELIAERGNIDSAEMHRVFNMGVGMVISVPRAETAQVCDLLPAATVIGSIAAGTGIVRLEVG